MHKICLRRTRENKTNTEHKKHLQADFLIMVIHFEHFNGVHLRRKTLVLIDGPLFFKGRGMGNFPKKFLWGKKRLKQIVQGEPWR